MIRITQTWFQYLNEIDEEKDTFIDTTEITNAYRDNNDYRENRDRNNQNRDDKDGAASRGSYGRGRRDARGGRRRGRGQNHQAQPSQQVDDAVGKVQKPKPTKEAIWKHSDTDKEAVMDAFSLHDS